MIQKLRSVHDPILSSLLLSWLALMMAMPWLQWLWGDAMIPQGISVAAILQATTVFYALSMAWGSRRVIIVFLVIALLTWGAEFIGHTTGLPFGSYDYTARLQPQLLGVPLLIPIAWFMMLPPSWAMAQLIVRKRDRWQGELAFIVVSAAAFTAWDFFLDPQMVAWDFWVWEQAGGYFGIPWINYLGWFLVSALVTASVRPTQLPVMPLALIYILVLFFQSIGQGIIWGQPYPALVGTVLMGSVVVMAYVRAGRSRHEVI